MKVYVCYYDDGIYDISLPCAVFRNKSDAIAWCKSSGGDCQELELQ